MIEAPTSAGGARFPFPLPNGWFALAFGDELARGEVKRVFAFGQELALFRAESGRAHVFDAYCPHLGAHLAVGGKVAGETLRCPFHGWRFDGAGRCVEVPYAERIPARAQVHPWPVRERYGLIFVWNHAAREAPSYELPDVPELESADWAAPERREWSVRTAIQEMGENDHDNAHFAAVHGGNYLPTSVRYEGRMKTCVSPFRRELPDGTKLDVELVRTSYQLGLATVAYRGVPGFGFLMLSSVLPVDAERVHMRWLLTVTANLPPEGRAQVIQGICEGAGVAADIPIWEHKRYLSNPVLCDGDGSIAEFRRWATQFYSAPAPRADG